MILPSTKERRIIAIRAKSGTLPRQPLRTPGKRGRKGLYPQEVMDSPEIAPMAIAVGALTFGPVPNPVLVHAGVLPVKPTGSPSPPITPSPRVFNVPTIVQATTTPLPGSIESTLDPIVYRFAPDLLAKILSDVRGTDKISARYIGVVMNWTDRGFGFIYPFTRPVPKTLQNAEGKRDDVHGVQKDIFALYDQFADKSTWNTDPVVGWVVSFYTKVPDKPRSPLQDPWVCANIKVLGTLTEDDARAIQALKTGTVSAPSRITVPPPPADDIGNRREPERVKKFNPPSWAPTEDLTIDETESTVAPMNGSVIPVAPATDLSGIAELIQREIDRKYAEAIAGVDRKWQEQLAEVQRKHAAQMDEFVQRLKRYADELHALAFQYEKR